jgi:hypothetical protein
VWCGVVGRTVRSQCIVQPASSFGPFVSGVHSVDAKHSLRVWQISSSQPIVCLFTHTVLMCVGRACWCVSKTLTQECFPLHQVPASLAVCCFKHTI